MKDRNKTYLTKDDFNELLKAFNDIRRVCENAIDMHDLYLSDIGKLEMAIFTMQRKLNFKPRKCDTNGELIRYADYVLSDDKRAWHGE